MKEKLLHSNRYVKLLLWHAIIVSTLTIGCTNTSNNVPVGIAGFLDEFRNTCEIKTKQFSFNDSLSIDDVLDQQYINWVTTRVSSYSLYHVVPPGMDYIHTDGMMYDNFKLKVFTYENEEDATLAFGNLAAYNATNNGLSQTFDYLILSQQTIYWLDGQCYFAEEHWNGLRDKLQKYVLVAPSTRQEMNCACASSCIHDEWWIEHYNKTKGTK